MKTLLLTSLIFASNLALADKCESLKPEANYFDTEFILSYIYAPNWDDLCFELEDTKQTYKCYAEAAKWEAWYSCSTQ